VSPSPDAGRFRFIAKVLSWLPAAGMAGRFYAPSTPLFLSTLFGIFEA